jgi:hypothetical protein
MKRDMELIRKILFALEERESGFAGGELAIEGHSEDEIGYHVLLMMEAGLVHGIETTHRGSAVPTGSAARPTWKGYEFLDASRNNTLWNKAKGKVKDVGGSVAFATLMALLKKLAAEALGIPV